MNRHVIEVSVVNGDTLTLEVESNGEISAILWSESCNTYAELAAHKYLADGRPSVLLTEFGLTLGRSCVWLSAASSTAIETFLRSCSYPFEDLRNAAVHPDALSRIQRTNGATAST